ncbi:MAG TPA: glycine oxidase ThiO [Vicinamibacterales bacterium]|nr:glycine oxidase ThiO [Vicinamibacterales bacterium]
MTDCDVAVIGAGVIGEAVAYELVARGASVTLLDCRGAGLGSTQAAAGMLVPYLEGFGRPLLPLAVQSLQMYDAFVDRVSRDSGMRVGYHRTGSLHVTTADEPREYLLRIAEAARAAGVELELLDANGARDAEPQLTSKISCALLVETHGFVVASDLSGALSAAAIKHGARLRVPARAHRIVAGNGGIEIQLDNDRLTARHVVVAAGSWSGQIAIDGVPSLPVRPVRGQLLQLAWNQPPLQRIVWGARCYLVPTGPTTILVGATVEEAGFDERTTVEGVRELLDAACDLVPGLRQATFAGARVGLRPATADELPLIGRSAKIPGLVYATGHYRNGVLLAPLTARAVADLILDNREDPLLACASPGRFGEY